MERRKTAMGLEKTLLFHRQIGKKVNDAPRLGLEPRTLKLTASCSAIELSGIVHLLKTDAILSTNQTKYQN